MKTFKKHNTLELIEAKMLRSKMDGRLAYLKDIEDYGQIVLEMDGIGFRRFHDDTIFNGFIFIMTNEDVVRHYFSSRFYTPDLMKPGAIWGITCRIFDDLQDRFEDLTNEIIYGVLEDIQKENETSRTVIQYDTNPA